MLRPSQEEFERLATRGNLVAVVREILADMDTPLALFRRLDDGRTSFLFESVEGGEKWGRYSFIGTGARAVFRARGSAVEWSCGDETQRLDMAGDPLEFLRDKLAEFDPVTPEDVELPRFLGGAVGMISYDWVRFVEKVPDGNPDEIGVPDLWFVLPETIVVHDGVRKTAFIVRHVYVSPEADVAALYRQAEAAIGETIRCLRRPAPPEVESESVLSPMDIRSSMAREPFHEIEKRAKNYFEAGDAFQIVL